MWQLAVDSGMLVLIWMTQLVVYPSFLYFLESDLLKWHKRYTKSITVVVAPLMLLQIALSANTLLKSNTELANWLHLGLIFIAWAITFLKAVPLHNQIDARENVTMACQKQIGGGRWFGRLPFYLVCIFNTSGS